MKNLLNKIKNLLIKLSHYIPTKLPVGMTEFHVWADSIIDAYKIPNNDSARFMLATMILHLESTAAVKAKRYFGLASLKSMSNQVAAGVMQDLKAKQAAEMAAALAKPVVETTATPVIDVIDTSNTQSGAV